MRRAIVLAGFFGGAVAQACSSTPEPSDGGTDAATDTTQQQDVVATDTASDVTSDVMEAGCPASWTALPDAGAALALPDGGGGLLIHAAGSGSQDYTCEATGDAGTYGWVFVGPDATLSDCAANIIGHHFASEAGAAAPEWQTTDMSYIIGKKLVAFTPDGGAGSVPWLLLQTTSSGGTGTISQTLYVQRLFTSGGVTPTTTCDGTNAGTTMHQAYTADYYFYGN